MIEKSNILRLIEARDDPNLWSLEDMLKDVLAEPDSLVGKKGILLILENDSENFNPAFFNCGLKRSEIVALLELSKFMFLRSLADDKVF